MPTAANKLAYAIRLALPLGMVLASSAYAQTADSTTTAPTTDSGKAVNLDKVSVTGSLVRRVDTETASPVAILGRAEIEQSGKQTMGDLIQSLPGISGNATNPSVNNGGGDGASQISLRGLGPQRTLMLIDGHRVAYNDLNSIPVNMVERIEVLKVGASAVYGSDAIGGVLNIILRKNFEGAEFTANYGDSSHSDGSRSGGNFTFGKTWDRGSIVAGLDYNKQNAVSSAKRGYSKDALYLTSGVVTKSGSSRTPNGYFRLPAATLAAKGCDSDGALTSNGSGGYKCYGSSDAYNFQAENLLLTPQKRVNAFVMGSFDITDNTQAYIQAYHNHTMSNSSIAALPFDAQQDGITIAANNANNPFGVEFGPNGYEYRTRFTSAGNRESFYDTNNDQILAGLKGAFGDSTWIWNADFNYGHYIKKSWSHGYVDYTALQDAINSGEVNILDQNSSATTSWLQSHQSIPRYRTDYVSRQWEASANGDLWELPAGAMSLAVGVSYRKESENYTVSDNATMVDGGTTCAISSEACSSPTGGSFNVKEAYAQLFVPILDQSSPIGAVNVTLSDRYSDYSSVKSTNNSSSFQMEWRPIKDLLLRGTVAQVFRAPTLDDMYQGPVADSPNFVDPCIDYSGSGHPNACSGVPTGWAGSGLSQTSSIDSGSKYVGYDLKPEKGTSYDYGFVYSPEWAPGLSINGDFWQVKLHDLIQSVTAQTVGDLCYADDSSSYCSMIHRYPSTSVSAGEIQYIETPTVNIGKLNTKGIDFGLNYALKDTPYGNFNLALDTTYTRSYDINTGTTVYHLAGKYDSTFGNYARWRGRAVLDWNRGNWNAEFTERWVGNIHVDSETDPLNIGNFFYHSVQVGYTIPQIKVHLDVGVDNLSNKQPPILYMNNVINANTDVSTYDLIGRYYWMRATYRF